MLCHQDFAMICLQELKRDMDDHAANKEYINRTGHELISRYPTDMAGVLEADLSSLNSRWQAVSTAIEQRQARLEKAISQMKEYQVVAWVQSVGMRERVGAGYKSDGGGDDGDCINHCGDEGKVGAGDESDGGDCVNHCGDVGKVGAGDENDGGGDDGDCVNHCGDEGKAGAGDESDGGGDDGNSVNHGKPGFVFVDDDNYSKVDD